MLPPSCGKEGAEHLEADDLKRSRSVIGHLFLSAIAAMILLIVSWTGPLTSTALTFEDRLTPALAFMLSCAMGIVLSLGPRKLHPLKIGNHGDKAVRNGDRAWVGHHPDCERFEHHVIAIGQRRYCAGCLGLALGSLLSLIIMALYLLVPPVDISLGRWLVILGIFIVSVCIAEVAWHPTNSSLHVLSNFALVVGFLLVIIGAISSTIDAVFSLFAILICYLWLDTRIQVSGWKHQKVCRICDRSCRAY